LAEETEASLWQERVLAGLGTIFAFLAVLLTAIGLYGLLSGSVTRRRREIGIRMALGARAAQVARLVLSQAGRLVIAGIVLGGAAFLAGARWMQHLVYGVEPADPRWLLASIILIGVVGLIAAGLPARKAVRIDPAMSLRDE
jgi:ABC-type antimicrobial peptide transport system permease subunit